ncbi:hypothetical protein AKJ16_DCAP12443 [Drosera capensis]
MDITTLYPDANKSVIAPIIGSSTETFTGELILFPAFDNRRSTMAGREVREYTNLSDPKDKKWGKGKDKIDDEDITFQRMVAKMQEVAGERGGYLHGRGALDSDDLLYLKEQMEAEEDAERLIADSSPAPIPAVRVEPKPKRGIRQQHLLQKVVQIKPKRQKVSSPSTGDSATSSNIASTNSKSDAAREKEPASRLEEKVAKDAVSTDNPVKLLGLAYDSSDSEE